MGVFVMAYFELSGNLPRFGAIANLLRKPVQLVIIKSRPLIVGQFERQFGCATQLIRFVPASIVDQLDDLSLQLQGRAGKVRSPQIGLAPMIVKEPMTFVIEHEAGFVVQLPAHAQLRPDLPIIIEGSDKILPKNASLALDPVAAQFLSQRGPQRDAVSQNFADALDPLGGRNVKHLVEIDVLDRNGQLQIRFERFRQLGLRDQQLFVLHPDRANVTEIVAAQEKVKLPAVRREAPEEKIEARRPEGALFLAGLAEQYVVLVTEPGAKVKGFEPERNFRQLFQFVGSLSLKKRGC